MEDSHAIVLDLDEQETETNAFFAVYDGHGGMSFLLLFDSEITLSRRHCCQVCWSECTQETSNNGVILCQGIRDSTQTGFSGY